LLRTALSAPLLPPALAITAALGSRAPPALPVAAVLSLLLPGALPVAAAALVLAGGPVAALTASLVTALPAAVMPASVALLPPLLAPCLPDQLVVLAQVLKAGLKDHDVPLHVLRHLLEDLVGFLVFRLRREEQIVAPGRLRHGNRPFQVTVYRHARILLQSQPWAVE
jgi:hypothetical protein